MRQSDVTVRMAKNQEDGPHVEAIMAKLDFFQWDDFKIDWSDIEPNWLVAEVDDEFVGCIQVAPARPIGRIEILCVDPDLPQKATYLVAKALIDQAVGTVKMYGAQAVSSMIPYRYADYLHGALNRDWVEIDDGAMVLRRLV